MNASQSSTKAVVMPICEAQVAAKMVRLRGRSRTAVAGAALTRRLRLGPVLGAAPSGAR